VGLWTAIQIKLFCPTIKILVLEKHQHYQRAHIVMLEPKSLVGSVQHDPEFNKLKQYIISNKKIRTNDLEEKLVTLARKLGIQFLFRNVEDAKTLPAEYPNVKVFIGADGSHSVVRRQIFGERLAFSETQQYIVEAKYEALGTTRTFDLLTEAYPMMKAMDCIVSENMGKQRKDTSTPVTARFFISEHEYRDTKHATFKTPIIFPRDMTKISASVSYKVALWLAAKEKYAKEKIIKDSVKITSTKLNSYASQYFAGKVGDQTWCLVGDAASGFPYFRSLNVGLVAGTRLAHNVASFFRVGYIPSATKSDAVFGDVSDQFVDYAEFYKNFAASEYFASKAKNVALKSLGFVARFNNFFPWQFIKLGRKNKKLF